MSKKFITVTTYVLVMAIMLAGCNQAQKSANISGCSSTVAEAAVEMKADGYVSRDLAIKKCTKVTFKNSDSKAHWPASDIHPTHGIYPEFDPLEQIESGSEWSFVFDKVGNWKYHDHLYPTLRGVIAVTE